MRRFETWRTLLLASTVLACAGAGEQSSETATCAVAGDGPILSAPPAPACDNERLEAFDELLVLAPHPDDEVLAFGGLIAAYLEAGKPVSVVVTTDGDAYCDACRFWKSTSVTGPTCSAEDLSNFATASVDSFAEVRRAESGAALAILGAGEPTFLGYPDTGLAAAWANSESDDLEKPLRRSDFSACAACETCPGGYGEGPETELSAASLRSSLSELIATTSGNALVATTHWLDGHGDHAALGGFVRELTAEGESPRAVAYGVVHAHTPKDTPHSDCWYPQPQAIACPCFDEDCASADPSWLESLRAYRFRPDWPAALPDDADYGEESQLCLPESLWAGPDAAKLAAVSSFESQLGFAARAGEVPPALGGLMDCNGYLISFVRSTEAFVLVDPRS